MAYTANTGFRFYRDLRGGMTAPTPIRIRIANSVTLRVGDMVRVNTGGFVVTVGATAPVGGVLTGFVDNHGINPFSLGYNTGNPSVTLTGDDTLATSSTNQTRASYIYAEVIVDVAGEYLWRNKADGSFTQTNLFQFFDVDANSRQVATGGASDSNGQLQLMAIDPEGTTMEGDNVSAADATIGLFRIAENQYGLGIDTGTAKIGS